MSDFALTEWEGSYVTVWGGSSRDRMTGKILRVGRDGIAFQPMDTPYQSQNLAPPIFLAWHAVHRVVLEPQG
jgi:hypothetical protein